MRKTVAIFGTLMIAAVLIISGSTVAAWVWADHHEAAYTYCSNPTQAVGAPDGSYASLGFDGPPPVLGFIALDLGSLYAMPADQDFTVFADSPIEETYTAYVGITSDPQYSLYVGGGNDTRDFIFTTPASPPSAWYRYIFLNGTSGVQAGDYYYGPEIDAVGWDKP